MNVLSHEQQLTVLNMLVEGNSLRSITRMTGVEGGSKRRRRAAENGGARC